MTAEQQPAQLLVILPGGEFRLALDRRVTSIGAEEGCTLTLPGADLAPRHCVIQALEDGTGYEIFDLWSPTGVAINGQRQAATRLRPGDQIQIGSARLVYLEGTAPRPARAPRPAPSARAPAAPAAPAVPSWETLANDPFHPVPPRREAVVPDLVARAEPSPPEVRHPRESAVAASEPVAPPRPGRRAGVLRFLMRGLFGSAGALAFSLGARVVAARRRLHEHQQPAPITTLPAAPALERAASLAMAHVNARRHQHGFAHELVAALRATPYLVISAVIHILLLLVLSLLAAPGVEPEPPLGPLAASLEAELPALETVEFEEETALEPQIDDDPLSEPMVVEDLEPFLSEDDVARAPDPDELREDAMGDPFIGLSPTSPLGGGGLGLPVIGEVPGTEGFGRYVRGLRRTGLDVVFVIDSTGSMGRVLDDARKSVAQMVAALAALVPGFRLGMVTYRDEGSGYVTRAVALTEYRYKVVDFLDGIEAEAGGDMPEAVKEGLEAAISDMRWGSRARRLVVLVGDAPPHAGDKDEIMRLARGFEGRRGTIHTIYTPGGLNMDEDPKIAAFFRSLANVTGGTFARLNQDQEVLLGILRVAFGRDQEQGMTMALQEATEGWKAQRWEREAREADPETIRSQLSRERVREGLVKALAASGRRDLVPAYLAVVGDREAPEDARWAAVVLTKRLLVGVGWPMPASLAEAFTPEAPARSLEAAIRRVRELAERAGLTTNTSRGG